MPSEIAGLGVSKQLDYTKYDRGYGPCLLFGAMMSFGSVLVSYLPLTVLKRINQRLTFEQAQSNPPALPALAEFVQRRQRNSFVHRRPAAVFNTLWGLAAALRNNAPALLIA
jgi:hypothetical protein